MAEYDDLTPEERAAELWRRMEASKRTRPPAPGVTPEDSQSEELGDTDSDDSGPDSDLIPDVSRPASHARSQDDLEVDALLDGIDILDAYTRWCGKMVPKVGSKRESIMVSCPNPSHPDEHPSAWINLDKQTWVCGGCGFAGGDKYDIAAWHFGYSVPGYKRDGSFPKLRRNMAADLGWVIKRTLGGQEYLEHPEPLEEPGGPPRPSGSSEGSGDDLAPLPPNVAPDQVSSGTRTDDLVPEISPGGQPEASTATVIEFPRSPGETSVRDSLERDLRVDWEPVVPKETFHRQYMEDIAVPDDLPHEYHFWQGLQAIGFANAGNVIIQDHRPVKGNLFVLLYGTTGSGKSRSIYPFIELIKDAFPFIDDPFTPSDGTKILSNPGSAEALVDQFEQKVADPADTSIEILHPVRGHLTMEEFAAVMAKASRSGSTLKEEFITLYDFGFGLHTQRSRTHGVIETLDPFLQMTTGTQPKAISNYMDRADADNGVLNRFIIASGRRRRPAISWGGASIDISRSSALLRQLRMPPRVMILDGDAFKAWDAFFTRELLPLKDDPDSEPLLARLDLQLKKLILLFTINERELDPTADIVERVCTLTPTLRASAVLLGGDLMSTPYTRCDEDIQRIVFKLGNTTNLTFREIERRYHNRHPRPLAIRVLEDLYKCNIIHDAPLKGARGPGTRIYKWGPA